MCFIPHLFECCSRICCGITSQPQYQLSQYHLVRSLRPFSLRPCKTIVICHLDMCDETGLCHYSLSLSVPLYFGSLQFTPLRWLIFGVCGSHICKICKRVAPLTSGPIHARDLDLSGDYLWTAKHPKNIPTTSQIYQAYGDWWHQVVLPQAMLQVEDLCLKLFKVFSWNLREQLISWWMCTHGICHHISKVLAPQDFILEYSMSHCRSEYCFARVQGGCPKYIYSRIHICTYASAYIYACEHRWHSDCITESVYIQLPHVTAWGPQDSPGPAALREAAARVLDISFTWRRRFWNEIWSSIRHLGQMMANVSPRRNVGPKPSTNLWAMSRGTTGSGIHTPTSYWNAEQMTTLMRKTLKWKFSSTLVGRPEIIVSKCLACQLRIPKKTARKQIPYGLPPPKKNKTTSTRSASACVAACARACWDVFSFRERRDCIALKRSSRLLNPLLKPCSWIANLRWTQFLPSSRCPMVSAHLFSLCLYHVVSFMFAGHVFQGTKSHHVFWDSVCTFTHFASTCHWGYHLICSSELSKFFSSFLGLLWHRFLAIRYPLQHLCKINIEIRVSGSVLPFAQERNSQSLPSCDSRWPLKSLDDLISWCHKLVKLCPSRLDI